jgi:hypothetical protein
MTSAMLLEYEDNNVGEDEVCKRSTIKMEGQERRNAEEAHSSWPLAWLFHVSRTRDWSPFNPIYAGTMRLCKWIKAYGHCRVHTLNDISGVW